MKTRNSQDHQTNMANVVKRFAKVKSWTKINQGNKERKNFQPNCLLVRIQCKKKLWLTARSLSAEKRAQDLGQHEQKVKFFYRKGLRGNDDSRPEQNAKPMLLEICQTETSNYTLTRGAYTIMLTARVLSPAKS